MVLGTSLIARIYHQLLILDSADVCTCHVIVPVNGTPDTRVQHNHSSWCNICSAPIKLVHSECVHLTFYQYSINIQIIDICTQALANILCKSKLVATATVLLIFKI